MAYEIVLGREEAERDKWGIQGTVFLGKQYVKMDATTALSQPVYLDLNKAHVVFVTGKRGSGKSYAMGVIAEGIATLPDDYRSKLSVIMLDTMGVYWTMKYPNNREAGLLKSWNLEPGAIQNIKIFTPIGYFDKYKESGIPTDAPFAILPSELSPEDWWLTFDLVSSDPIAVLIEQVVLELRKSMGEKYRIQDIIDMIEASNEEAHVKYAAINRFKSAIEWGLFSEKSTPIADLASGGQITVLDMSPYAIMPNGWKIKNLAIGLVCSKLFIERMKFRKEEESRGVKGAIHYILPEEVPEKEMPLVWLMLDEAHEMLPLTGQTSATPALITLLREGRQPGIALVLATQQPGMINTDAMTQSDVILAHHLTARIDTEALGNLLQTYMRAGLDRLLNDLPRTAGACLAMDDVNERIYPMQIRPRFSWHGGSAPGILKEKKKLFG